MSAREWENGWQGGRFDANRPQRHSMLTLNGRKTPLFGVSEAYGLHPLEGWGMAGGECVSTWDKKVWRLKHHGVVHMPTARWIRGTSVRHTVELYYALMENVDDWTLLDLRQHLPAHLPNIFQARANTSALNQLDRHILRLQELLDPDETDYAADVNRDMRLQKNRDLMRRSLAGTGMELILPPRGTHGDRKIDVRASTCDRHGPGVMFGKRPGYDHVGFKNHQESA